MERGLPGRSSNRHTAPLIIGMPLYSKSQPCLISTTRKMRSLREWSRAATSWDAKRRAPEYRHAFRLCYRSHCGMEGVFPSGSVLSEAQQLLPLWLGDSRPVVLRWPSKHCLQSVGSYRHFRRLCRGGKPPRRDCQRPALCSDVCLKHPSHR